MVFHQNGWCTNLSITLEITLSVLLTSEEAMASTQNWLHTWNIKILFWEKLHFITKHWLTKDKSSPILTTLIDETFQPPLPPSEAPLTGAHPSVCFRTEYQWWALSGPSFTYGQQFPWFCGEDEKWRSITWDREGPMSLGFKALTVGRGESCWTILGSSIPTYERCHWLYLCGC